MLNNRSSRLFQVLAGVLVVWTATSTLPPLAAATLPCEIDGIERIVAVGDVHGAYDRFVAILRTAGVIDDRLHWAAGKTHLVQLGDIVDRGPDSRKALDLMQRLEAEAPHAGGQVHALLGNHEVARMLGDLRLVSPGEYAAFATTDSDTIRRRFIESLPASTRDDALKDTPLGFVEMRIAFGPNGVYGKWLRMHQAVVKLNGVLFLHGGISPAVAALPCAVINDTVHEDLTGSLDKTIAAPLKTLTARVDGPLWYRGLAEQPDTFAPEVADILSKQQARAIVIGHNVVPGGRIAVRFGGTVVLIDTGMQQAYVPTGRASALEISHGEFTAIYEDRRDVLSVAPKASAASGNGGSWQR
jgi:hypothetical protein